ncbi:MAG: GIY-YIG nuclease family protein [Pseudomonadota bacterium]
MKAGYVYIMANQKNGTMYVGATSDLVKRIWEHRDNVVPGFTRRYGCNLPVWFEVHDDVEEARRRELQLKKWKRAWKIRVIEEANFDWADLYPAIVDPAGAGLDPGLRRGTEVR